MNYVIEKRNFPEIWAEGLKSGVFKSGKRNLVDNYRGITILPVIEKIFEVAVYKRLSFANEAMGKLISLTVALSPGAEHQIIFSYYMD